MLVPDQARAIETRMTETVRATTIVLEARLTSSGSGLFTSVQDLAGMNWAAGLESIPNLRLAARAHPGPDAGLLAMDGTHILLPHYIGLFQLLRRLPKVIWHINRLVSTSSVLVVRQPGPLGLLTTFIAKLRRRTVAAQVVGDIGPVLRSGAVGRAAKHLAPAAEWTTRFAIREASAVRYVTKSQLQHRFPSSKGAFSFAISDVELGTFPPLRAAEPSHLRILSIGSHENSYKGYEFLFEAIPEVVRQHPSVQVRLIGEGRHQTSLMSLRDKLGLKDVVEFPGYISSKDQLIAELDDCTVFVLPSLTEGLPRALIEAMARGLPCTASNVGGIPELLAPKFLFPPKSSEAITQALLLLLADPSLRVEQGAHNLSKAMEYGPGPRQATLHAWRDCVQSLAEGISR